MQAAGIRTAPRLERKERTQVTAARDAQQDEAKKARAEAVRAIAAAAEEVRGMRNAAEEERAEAKAAVAAAEKVRAEEKRRASSEADPRSVCGR